MTKLYAADPLVLHTQLTENNSTFRAGPVRAGRFQAPGSSDYARNRLESLCQTLSDLFSAAASKAERTPRRSPVRQHIGLGAQFAAVGAKFYAADERRRVLAGRCAGLVHSGRASLTGVRNAFAVSYESMPEEFVSEATCQVSFVLSLLTTHFTVLAKTDSWLGYSSLSSNQTPIWVAKGGRFYRRLASKRI